MCCSDHLGTSMTVFTPQKIPCAKAFVKNDTSLIYPCCSFQEILLSERTDSGMDGSTADSTRAASKSCLRKRHTRRRMPDSANAFTLPWRTHNKSVRTLTLRYSAASFAVSHSLSCGLGFDIIDSRLRCVVECLRYRIRDEYDEQRAADHDHDSHDSDFHLVGSLHSAMPSHPRSGQRKPLTLPSNMLVLTNLGVIQNLCPQSGQVNRYRCSM